MSEMRVCSGCGLEKPITKFGVGGHGKGRRKLCYTCRNQAYIDSKVSQALSRDASAIAKNSKGWGYI